MSKDSSRDRFLGKYIKIKAVVNDIKGLFLELYNNIEQAWITFKLLKSLKTLAKRAAHSAASNKTSDSFLAQTFTSIVYTARQGDMK